MNDEPRGGVLPGQVAGLLWILLFAAAMTTAIALLTPNLTRFESASAHLITRDSELPPAERAAHYEWKLNVPTLGSRLSSWGLYGIHQLLAWGLIAWGVSRKKKNALLAEAAGRKAPPRFGDRLEPAGLAFFAVNVLFGLLHLWQTQSFYDGLAQDVPVVSSQYSVIVMLVLILILQNERRGLLFGWKAPMPRRAVEFVKKYHGYYIAWALVYTFWFHPMTGTVGHLLGFFYMFVLLGQGALVFTKLHLSLKWSAFLEALVLLHGAVVAYALQSSAMWTMFATGFGFMFVGSQLWGLRLPKALAWAGVAAYVGAVALLYSGLLSAWGPLWAGSPSRLYQVSFIPVTLYGLVPVFLALAALLSWLGSAASRGGAVKRGV